MKILFQAVVLTAIIVSPNCLKRSIIKNENVNDVKSVKIVKIEHVIDSMSTCDSTIMQRKEIFTDTSFDAVNRLLTIVKQLRPYTYVKALPTHSFSLVFDNRDTVHYVISSGCIRCFNDISYWRDKSGKLVCLLDSIMGSN